MATNFKNLQEIFKQLEGDLLPYKSSNTIANDPNLKHIFNIIKQVKYLIDNKSSIFAQGMVLKNLKPYQDAFEKNSRYPFSEFNLTNQETYRIGQLIYEAFLETIKYSDENLDINDVFDVSDYLNEVAANLFSKLEVYKVEAKYQELKDYIDNKDRLKPELSSLNKDIQAKIHEFGNTIQTSSPTSEEDIERLINSLKEQLATLTEETNAALKLLGQHEEKLKSIEELGVYSDIIETQVNKAQALNACQNQAEKDYFPPHMNPDNPVRDVLSIIQSNKEGINICFQEVSQKANQKIAELIALQTPTPDSLKVKLEFELATFATLSNHYNQLNDEIAELKANIDDLTKNTEKLGNSVNQPSTFIKKDQIQVDSAQLNSLGLNNQNSTTVKDFLEERTLLNGNIWKSEFDKIAKIILEASQVKLDLLVNDKAKKEQERFLTDSKLNETQVNITSITSEWLKIVKAQENLNNQALKKRADDEKAQLEQLNKTKAQIEQFKKITMAVTGKDEGASDRATELLKQSMFNHHSIDIVERGALQHELRMILQEKYFNPTSGLFTQFKGFSIFNVFFNLECFKINLECFKFFNHFLYKKTEYIAQLERFVSDYGVSTTHNDNRQEREQKYQQLKGFIEQGLREFPPSSHSLGAHLKAYQNALEAIFPEDITPPQSAETDPHNSAASTPTQSRSLGRLL